ncbi:LamG-like jellyroll fold domain-containing protein [Thermodesulfobacteriota bacterium]
MKKILCVIGLSASIIASASLSQSVFAAPRYGLAGYWGFDNCTSSDDSGKGYDATAYGPEPVCIEAAGGGRALAFDGSSHLQTAPPANITDALSLVVWARPVSDNNTNGHYLLHSGAEDGGYWSAYSLIYHAGSFWFELKNSTANTWIEGPAALGAWHGVVGTWNGTEMKLYIDGSLAAQAPFTGTVNPQDDGLFIGGYGAATPDRRRFVGAIDEAGLYTRALSESQIQGLNQPLLDDDADGIVNGADNCPGTANANQNNADSDRAGDACDPDTLFGQVTGGLTSGVTVELLISLCGGEHVAATTITDAAGRYVFGGVGAWSYRIQPRDAGCSFTPGFSAVQIPLAQHDPFNFTANCPP